MKTVVIISDLHCGSFWGVKPFNPPPPIVDWDKISDLRHRAERLQIYFGNGMCCAKELVEEIDKIIEGVRKEDRND